MNDSLKHDFAREETTRLIDHGATDRMLIDLMTGVKTINETREDLQLHPLNEPTADEHIILEPYGFWQQIRPAVFREVCARILNGDTEHLRAFRNHIIRNFDANQLVRIMDCFTDTVEADT